MQHSVARQPYCVEDSPLLQVLIDVRLGECGIGPKVPAHSCRPVDSITACALGQSSLMESTHSGCTSLSHDHRSSKRAPAARLSGVAWKSRDLLKGGSVATRSTVSESMPRRKSRLSPWNSDGAHRPGRRRELSRPGPRRAQARSTAAFAQGAPWADPPQS